MDLTLDALREIVQSEMPYDTGYMFTFGASYNETEQYLAVYYDTIAVPYIHWNEIGANNNPNKGFISVNTITAVNDALANLQTGNIPALDETMYKRVETNQKRISLIQQSVLEHVKSYGEIGGGPYDLYTG